MRTLHYRASAIRDLRDLAASTRERWGEDQARIYSSKLRTDIQQLREFALRYPEYVTRSGQKFRKIRSGSHIVFYVADEQTVEVVRLLYARADFNALLG